MNDSVIREPLNKLLLTIVIIAAVSLLVLVPIASVILASMLKGLRHLNQAMNEIARGEADLTRRIEVSGQDEIAETAHAFNLFVDLRGTCSAR
jgi:methyl-accepting chemotaxis protein